VSPEAEAALDEPDVLALPIAFAAETEGRRVGARLANGPEARLLMA
jgi:hypothetical protein